MLEGMEETYQIWNHPAKANCYGYDKEGSYNWWRKPAWHSQQYPQAGKEALPQQESGHGHWDSMGRLV
jgi:hypothetical protein